MITRRLAELNLVNIGVTLYGDLQTHQAYTGAASSYARAIDTVRRLRDIGCNVSLQWNALPETLDQTEAFIDLAEGVGVRWQVNGLINGCRDGPGRTYCLPTRT
jgi:MoaA/NifB/PqqE/SkfB family radical SAM enzyme